MRPEHVGYLACPACRAGLEIGEVRSRTEAGVEEGELRCTACAAAYPIRRHVPRLAPGENYAVNFGLEWLIHRTTQLDEVTGTDASRRRFFEETRWPERLEGEVVLEVGSGAGRFTGHAASTGAMVISLDYSHAVEANYTTNGHLPNLLIVQGDVYALPVPPASVDRVVCLGVLQHTPDPERAFHALLGPLKAGGTVAVDVYALRWYTPLITKYWVRPVTRRVPADRLYRWTRRYVHAVWPLARRLGRLPGGGRLLNQLLVMDNGAPYALSDEQRREWAVLDTFDVLSPAYDRPQSLRAIGRWFRRAGLQQVEVHNGWNGIEARGVKPADAA